MNHVLSATVLFAGVLVSSAARAEPDPAVDGALRGYYAGERDSAYLVGGLGVASAVAGGVLVTRGGDFSRGLGWPLLSLGGLEAVGAVVYALQVAAEIDRYEGLLARDPAAFARTELEHIEGTTSRFIGYRLFELGLVVAGAALATYGFAANQDAWKGAGIGVGAVGLPLFVLDTVNQGRAVDYRERLRGFRPSVAVGPVAGGWGAALGAVF